MYDLGALMRQLGVAVRIQFRFPILHLLTVRIIDYDLLNFVGEIKQPDSDGNESDSDYEKRRQNRPGR